MLLAFRRRVLRFCLFATATVALAACSHTETSESASAKLSNAASPAPGFTVVPPSKAPPAAPAPTNTPQSSSNGEPQIPTAEEAERSAAAEDCAGGVHGGPLWSAATGVVLLRTAATDTILPWENRPSKMTVQFCDDTVGQRLAALTRGTTTLPRAIINGSNKMQFDMRDVQVRKDTYDYFVLRFRAIHVASPEPP